MLEPLDGELPDVDVREDGEEELEDVHGFRRGVVLQDVVKLGEDPAVPALGRQQNLAKWITFEFGGLFLTVPWQFPADDDENTGTA